MAKNDIKMGWIIINNNNKIFSSDENKRKYDSKLRMERTLSSSSNTKRQDYKGPTYSPKDTGLVNMQKY